MSSKKIQFIVLPVFLLLVAAIFFKNSISTDSSDLGKPVSTKILTLDLDGGKVSFNLLKYKNGNNFDFVLTKKNLFGADPSIKLSGFEDDLLLCDINAVKLNGGETAICLIGDAGVHSQNIEFVKYSNEKLSNIKITGGESIGDNISSDVPSFSFVDRNNDGFMDLAVDTRNYDGDPITESIRSYYINTSSGFVFDAKENITYNR